MEIRNVPWYRVADEISGAIIGKGLERSQILRGGKRARP
jgi:hypothetical protein